MASLDFLKKNASIQGALMLLLFLAFMIYAVFLLQGLSFYMYGYDDFHLMYQTLHISFLGLFFKIFFAPLELYQGFLQLGIFQRTIHGIFLKAAYATGGLDPFFHHAIRALFFAATGVFVYLFIKKITKNTLVSIGGASLYCSLPVIYDGLRHIGAAEPFSQFFLVLSMYLFACFFNQQEASVSKKCIYAVLVFLSALFAMKAREPEIVFFPIIGSFLLLKYKDWRKNIQWWLVLFFLSLYLVPAVFTQFNIVDNKEHGSIGITSEKVLANVKHLLFYNPETRTGSGEQIPVLFSLHQYLSQTPGSLLGSLGFFLTWYAIAMFCVYVYFLKQKEPSAEAIIPKSSAFTLVGLWLFFSILLMMLYVNPSDHSDIRYIGVMALPCIIVLISFCYFITAFIQKKEMRFSKKILAIFLIVLFLSVTINASITAIHRRGGIGSRHVGMSMTTEILFEDMYNQSFTPYFFFALTEISGDHEYIACTLNTNITLKEVTVTNDPFLSVTKPITEENIEYALSHYGIVYVVSYRVPLSEDAYPNLQFVAQVNTCEEGYYCALKNIFKKQAFITKLFQQRFDDEPRYFIYKIVANAPLFEEPIKLFCSGKEGLHPNPLLNINL